ncbi:MAG: TonB-dependent receptor [Halieaceae bacterium]|jgi:iron complex outermembrane receptor protein|nr:TonB-dependent receptor [Halieaceae bacterium]
MKQHGNALPRRAMWANLWLLAPLLTNTSTAWSQGASQLEEVIVTANRRQSSLLDTPIAISAFDAATLGKFSINSAQDLVARTPSLSMTGTPSKVSIRGVGRPNNALGSDPGVALYSDGVYTTEAGLFEYTNMFDTDRVEVLRGPQGTLYGRNAVGGAINIISMGPTITWKSKVNLELGNYDYQALQGLISGPITDQLSMVAAASSIKRSGFQEEVTSGEDFDDKDTRYLRLSFKYHWNNLWYSRIQFSDVDLNRRPSNGYRTLPFNTDYLQIVPDASSGAPLNLPGTFPGQNFVNFHQGYTKSNAAISDESKTQSDIIPVESTDTRSVYLLNEIALGNYRLKHLASYYEYDYAKRVDNDATNAADAGFSWSEIFLGSTPVSALTGIDHAPPMVTDNTAQEANFTSQDLQFYSELDGAINFVSGLYYYRSDEEQFFAVREDNDDVMAVYAFLGNLVGRNTSTENWLYRGNSNLITTTYAAYGQGTWDFSSQWRLTAGLRYSQDDKDGGDTTFVQWVGDGDISRKAKDNWDSVDWRLGLDYTFMSGQMLYGSLATGYRSGGFNFMKPTASTDVDRVAPEDLLSLELGYKGALIDNRLQLAAAAYFYDYQDLQVIRQDVVNGVALRSFSNADEAHAYGIEVEATALLNQYLSAGAAWSWNQTSYDEFASTDANACALGPLAQGNSDDPLCTEKQNLEGNSFPLTPEHKFSLWASAQWQWQWAQMSASVSYMYVGDQYMSPFNLDEYDKVKAWDRWDSQLSASYGPWSMTAFVKNIADERNWIFRERPSSVTHNYGPGTQLSAPRTWGLRLSHEL